MRITLLRHGETDFNKQLIVQGHLDIPLNEFGKEQAQLASLKLKSTPYDLIISSPLSRAYETAQIIAREINYTKDIIINQDFIERNFGIADGKLIKDYMELIHTGNVPGLESTEDLKKRVLNALKRVCHNNPVQSVLIVTHSQVIKATLNFFDESHYDFRTKLNNCSINNFECGNSGFKIIDVNA